MRVVICGGGVIGAAIAYFLSRRGAARGRHRARSASPARPPASPAASWRSTGATAVRSRRWRGGASRCMPSLADELGSDWGYRRLDHLWRLRPARAAASTRRRRSELAWLSDEVAIGRRLGTTGDDGPGPPGRLHARPDAGGGRRRERELRQGRVTGVVHAQRRASQASRSTARPSRPTRWSSPWDPGRSWPREWLPLPPVFGLKGHSIVFETGDAGAARGAVPRVSRGERRHAFARGLPARRRHHLCLRHLEREPAAGRSRRRSRRTPGAIERLQAICARDLADARPARRSWPSRPASGPVTRGRPAADRPGAGRRRAPMSPPATASGASSTRPRPARRWPS